MMNDELNGTGFQAAERELAGTSAALAIERQKVAVMLAALQFSYAHCDPTPAREEEWQCIPKAIQFATKGKGAQQS